MNRAWRQRKVTVYLDHATASVLEQRARSSGASVSRAAAQAIRDQLALTTAQAHDSLAAPVLDNLLLERLGQVETWLRPMVAATSIHAATAMLLTLEILCGTRVDPSRAKETLDMMRGRAYKMIRRREEGEGER